MSILFRLPMPSIYGSLIKRYNRFLADVELDSGDNVTAYCPNPGRMLSCSDAGARVRLHATTGGKRRYAYQLDLVQSNHQWVGVNPSWANPLVQAAIDQRWLWPNLNPSKWRREVPYDHGCRIDFLYEDGSFQQFVEVKSVSYAHQGQGYFPDAVSKRALTHLQALTRVVKDGHRATLLYCIQRSDVDDVMPAHHIDPNYAAAYHHAVSHGVTVMVMRTEVDALGNIVYWRHH